jgi:hypothetical protein
VKRYQTAKEKDDNLTYERGIITISPQWEPWREGTTKTTDNISGLIYTTGATSQPATYYAASNVMNTDMMLHRS